MTDTLLIVFVKNIELGKVKTRLAKTIGNAAAFEVYSELVDLTEKVTNKLITDKRIYFSRKIVDEQWQNVLKEVQKGDTLGERMLNAITEGFAAGYKRIVLIGSDLPDLSAETIERAFKILDDHEVVFGPAEDGGYYLVGFSKLIPFVFKNKPWSQKELLKTTLEELEEAQIRVGLLDTKNDIDTFEDLINSDFYKTNLKLKEKIKQLNA